MQLTNTSLLCAASVSVLKIMLSMVLCDCRMLLFRNEMWHLKQTNNTSIQDELTLMLLHVTRMKFITIQKILVVLRRLSLVSGLTEMVSTILSSVLLLCRSIGIMFLLYNTPLQHTMTWLTAFCALSLNFFFGLLFLFWIFFFLY